MHCSYDVGGFERCLSQNFHEFLSRAMRTFFFLSRESSSFLAYLSKYYLHFYKNIDHEEAIHFR
jgi:hypothetical protein